MRQKQFLLAFLAMLLCFAAPSFAQVAKIGDTKYTKLSDAITAATAGQTIELIADVNQNVTISKNLTIDGAGKTYTGTMTASKDMVITITNVNFVKGCFVASGTSSKITITDCSFNGEGTYYTWPVQIKGTNTLKINNCNANNGQGLVYVSSSLANCSIKNVNVDNCNYGVRMASTNTTNLENFVVTNTVYPIQIQSNAARTVNMTNCSITALRDYNAENPGKSLSSWGGTSKVTYNFKGVNTFDTTLPTDYTYNYAATNGNGLYGDLASVIAAAESGATVEIMKNIVLDNTVVIPTGKSITLDLNEKTISQEKACTASYQMIENNGNLTITGNGKLSFKDTGAGDPSFGWGSYTINNRGTLVVENGTIEHLGEQNPGNGQPNKHMYCAIFQYSGSTTIYGGKISTPTYRSARLWKGVMTINGGEFEGQLWVQAVDNSAKLTIINGTFAPRGNDGSSVFVTNDQYNVEFAVENGTFNGKIGCSDATKLAGTINGGKFTAAAKEGTNPSLLAEGAEFGELNNDGYYEVASAPKVAEVGGVVYRTLADALAAAQAGQTITFMADITEDVTISKAITIDGAGKTYTGAMTVKADATIKNVNFDGKGYNGYAITTRGANYLTIEDCTAKNYGYGFVQLASATALTTVKNVTASNVNYGVKVDYSGAVVLENVDFTATVAAVLNSNYGEKTITVKNSNLNILGTWKRNDTTKTYYVFEGANTIGKFVTEAAIDNFKLVAGATLTAPNEITVTTDKCYKVEYAEGKYITNFIPAGSVAYRADVTDKADREGIAILLKEVAARESLVVKVYNDETLMFTCTRRDIDDENKVMFPVLGANTTANIVLSGKESGSWINEIHVEPTNKNVPNKVEIWADETLVQTYTHESGTILGTNLEKYLALDCVEKVKDSVVKIGEQGYETLAAALTAATAGQTITFLADVTEDVTTSKAVTIDGAGKTYTGKMTLKADATIKNVNFDGKGYNGYAVESRGANNLTIEDCTATNYGYGFVQLASGTALTTVKNVTVSDMNYGLKVDYSNAVVLENVDITAGVAAVLNSNYGEKTITIKDSKLNILGTWTRNNTNKTNYVFEGENTIDQFIIDAAIDNFKLAANATLTAPNEITVTTDISGYDVRYKDGKYYLVEVEAEVGGSKYETLAMALANADAGQTITLLRNINSSDIIVLNKAITLDGNGKKLTSTAGRAINVSGVDGVTIKNLTINASGERAINIIENATNVTIENVTATAANYTVNAATSAGATIINVTNSRLTGLNVVNIAAPGAVVTINGGKLTCNDQTDVESYAALCLNKNAVNATITATGVEFDIKGNSAKANNGAEGGSITIDGEEAGNKIVAVIEYEGTDNYYSFTTLADAVAKAQAGETVKLITDATGAGVVINKSITIDFNGKTYTANVGVGSAGTQTLGLQILKDNDVTLKNGTLKSEGGNVKMLVQNYANLTVENMKLVDATDAIQYVLSNNSGNVVVSTSEITANGAIAFDACKYANYALPTVTIAEGVVVTGDVEVSATLNFAGTLKGKIIINGAEGVVNSTVEGLNVTTTIVGRNVVYANGAYTTAEFEPVAEVNGKKYASLREAVDAAPAGATVELLADVTLVGGNEKDAEAGLVIDKAMTLDGKGYTIDCGTFVKGIRIYGSSALTDIKINNVTIVNNKATGRCVDTRSGYLRLKFNNANLIAHGTNSQPLTVGGNEKLHQIDLSGCTIDAGNSGYGIISFVPTNQAIKVMNSTVTGYAGIYLKGDGTKVTITTNSEVIGKNVHSGETNAFGAVVFEGNNNVVNINETSPMLKAIAEGDQAQAAILVKSGEGNKVVFVTNKKAEILAEGKNAYWAMVSAKATGTTITKDGAPVALQAECGGYQFLTLEDALRYSKNGDTVKLLEDVALDTKKLVAQNDGYATLINVADKALTFDLNGKTMEVTAKASDLANTQGRMLLSVFHADTNGQLTLVDSSEAQTGAVNVLANDAKIYCLAASESKYEDKSESGKIIVEGGTYTLDKAADSMFFSDANEVITINGGNFTLGNVGAGSNGMPWIFNTYERNERHVNVYGGTFNADINHQYWAFEVNVPTELALRNNGNGTWTVVNAEAWVLEKYNASYNREVGYATLEEALAVSNNVKNTVTLAKDLTRAGLVINKDITIDFNGKTYTATEGVGSTGTQTLGLQILKDNNVTLKNGTLTSEGGNVKMLVQNYANLTVENMNLVDATDAIQYVLSNNSGKSQIIGETNITTDAVAFDVYDYTKYYSAPELTIETTGTIAGEIEVSETLNDNLNIKTGTFTREIPQVWCAQYSVPVNNNDGTWTVEYRFIEERVIVDEETSEFENDKEYTVGTITYERYFNNTEWQTIYLPFAVPAANLMGEFEVAYIYNASYKGNVAAIDYVVVGSDYTLEANYPYLIRAKEAGEKRIVVENAKLMPTAVNSIDCSSVFETFTFTGNYETIVGEPCEATEAGCNKGHFVMNEGAWKRFDSLNPFRVYLTITLRNGSDFLYPTEESIIMRKVDKNGNVDTSVEKIGVDADILGIYDLQGRRVLEPQKGEIYIINGKKVVF